MKGCNWTMIRDISASGTQRYLADLRTGGLSVQTSNHYLRAIKQFSRWLVRDRRMPDDPLAHLAMLNVKTDRRHDRRALTADEFSRLIDAAMVGPEVVCIPGPDRAMMYVLAAWTGYRKTEISSLTKRSLRLDDRSADGHRGRGLQQAEAAGHAGAPPGRGRADAGLARHEEETRARSIAVPGVGEDPRLPGTANV